MAENVTPRGSRGSYYPYSRDAARRARNVYIKTSAPEAIKTANVERTPAEERPPERLAPTLPPLEPPTLPSDTAERDEDYEEYLIENPANGLLKVQAYRAREAIPQSGVGVKVSTYIGDRERTFFEGVTDENGIIDNIKLPAPPRANSLESGDPHPTATYLLSASEEGFIPITIGITIFDGIKTIQPLPMILRGGE